MLAADLPDASAALDGCHGLLLTGGGDIDPALYREAPHPTSAPAEPGRDATEIALVRAALAGRLPVLAICRGLQVLNVAFGGSLVQDIPSQVPGAVRHAVSDTPDTLAHDVRVTAGSRLAAVLALTPDMRSCRVNSRHHQAVARVADGFVVAGTSPDGVIEAIEHRSAPFCLGVQWHPENFWRTGEFRALFEGLIDAARTAAAAR